jgi:hypothetical protein
LLQVIVACQKGLRSLAACEQLASRGYGTLAWINGGLDNCLPGDLPVAGPNKDVRYAGIGGLSAVLGWTPLQQQESPGAFGGLTNLLKIVGVVLAIDLIWLGVEVAGALRAMPPAGP